MVFHAGFDTATPRGNTWTILFYVRSTSLADSPRLYQRKLAGQRKVFEMQLDARPATLTCVSRALSLYIGSACCNDLLREHHGRCSGNREKRYSRNSGEQKAGPCSHVEVPFGGDLRRGSPPVSLTHDADGGLTFIKPAAHWRTTALQNRADLGRWKRAFPGHHWAAPQVVLLPALT